MVLINDHISHMICNRRYKRTIKILSPKIGICELEKYLNKFNRAKKTQKRQYDKYRIFKNKGMECYLCGAKIDICLVQVDNMGTHCYNFYHINRKGVYIQFTVDHKIPKCKNGQVNLENAFPACIICNEKKALYDSDSGVAQFNHVLKILDRI